MKVDTRSSRFDIPESTFTPSRDECETHPYKPGRGDDPSSESPTSESSGAFAFEDLVPRMLSEQGESKQRLADELVERIGEINEKKSVRAAWACYLILQSAKPGRLGDCVGILSRLGPVTLRGCMLDALENRPPRSDDDYWFVMIRTLGYLCRQGHADLFRATIEIASRSFVVSLREASVYALADIGDDAAVERLQDIAHNDRSQAIRDLAADCLEDLDD